MGQEQKNTSIRFKLEHYKFLKDSAARNNRTVSGQANWLLEIVWHLEETRNDVFIEIINELTQPDDPKRTVKVRRGL